MAFVTSPPSRVQLAKIAGNDPELVRALERLFEQALSLTPTELSEVTAGIVTNTNNISTNTAGLATVNTRIDNLEIDDLANVSAASPSLGMVLIYNATAGEWQANTITAGSNITITNADGAITVAVSGLGTMAFENTGASGSFIAGLQTVTVVDGIITSIV